MATIKEKADQYGSVKRNVLGFKNLYSIEGFEAGANYVLEQIEEIIRYDKDPHVIEALKERLWQQ